VVNPGQKILNSKVYDFYKKFKEYAQNKGDGLISIDEYLHNCASIDNLRRDELYQEMKNEYQLDAHNKVFL
jgi:hypothetical protein